MPLEVVEEQLESARDEALTLLSATRNAPLLSDRFDWLYIQNPDGKAVLWSIREARTGEMAGFTVALPRRMIVLGQERLCWNCADFSIDPRYRTLGPALKLRRAAREGVEAGRVDFLYAHPNPRMAVIHERVGHTPLAPMVRVARVLRSSSFIQERVSSQALAAVVSGVVDPYLRWTAPERKHRILGDIRITHELVFDQRFTKLFVENAETSTIIGVRDTKYLQWRYANNPMEKYALVVSEQAGKLCGWLIFTVRENMVTIQDLFPQDDPAIARDLLAAVLNESRELGVRSISFTALQGNPLLPLFHEFGFRDRPETGRMFVYASSVDKNVLVDPTLWRAMVGDRDV